MPTIGRKQLADCGLSLATLMRIRLAISEPFVVRAEIDGALDTKKAACILGNDGMQWLQASGLAITDSRKGIRIAPSADGVRIPSPTVLSAAAVPSTPAARDEITVKLGPNVAPLMINIDLSAGIKFEMSGPGMGDAAHALQTAFAQLRAKHPELSALDVTARGKTLVISTSQAIPEFAELLHGELIEAISMPSVSMIPTMLVGETFYMVKGELGNSLTPGDVVVYRNDNGNLSVKRIIAMAGATVESTTKGIVVDSRPLLAEVFDDHYTYFGSAEDRGAASKGVVYREHLGARTYLTMATEHESDARIGHWVVPASSVFVLGDNRDNSIDSRITGPIAISSIVGRVAVRWLSLHDGKPQWSRMGVAIDTP